MLRNFAILTAVMCAIGFAVQVQAGLVAQWGFDESNGSTGATIVDLTGNGHTGTVVGTLTPGAGGMFGTAFTFPGGNNYVQVTNVTGLQSVMSLTQSVWIYDTHNMQGNPTGYTENGIMDMRRNGTNDHAYHMATNNWHSLNAIFANASNTYVNPAISVSTAVSTYGFTSNAWHLLTATYDGTGSGTAKLYLDGKLMVTSTGAGGGIQASTGALLLGGVIGTAGIGWQGRLDDISIWTGASDASGALSQAKIQALYWTPTVSGLGAYDSGAMAKLFGVYDNAGGSATVGSLTWQYVASGLPGTLGTASQAGSLGGGNYYVQLDANGGGVVTIPEPGTLALLTACLLGLLCYAWRKKN